jgi:hypothetical protein
VPALDFFSDDLGQDVLIEGEIGNEAFQSGILIFQLPELAQLTHT